MLKTIRLKNFKLHEDTQIEAAPITVFIGPNNSGKSSIFQTLLLLRQAAFRNDRLLCDSSTGEIPAQQPYQYSPQRSIDPEGFREIVRDVSNDLQVEFSGAIDAPTLVDDREPVSVSARLRVRNNQLVFHTGLVRASSAQTEWEFVQGTPPKVGNLVLGGVRYLIQPIETFNLAQTGGYQP